MNPHMRTAQPACRFEIGHGLLALAVGGAVLVAIGHVFVIEGQDSVVGDGDAEGVAGEIIEGSLLSLAPWRDVDDPGDFPNMGRQIGIRAEPGEGIAEAGAGKGGERRFGKPASFMRPGQSFGDTKVRLIFRAISAARQVPLTMSAEA